MSTDRASVFMLHDPTGDLPEDAATFVLGRDGLSVHDGTSDELSCTWAWARITHAEGVRDSADPTDMELLSLDVTGIGNLQFECDDARKLAALITASVDRAAATGAGAGSTSGASGAGAAPKVTFPRLPSTERSGELGLKKERHSAQLEQDGGELSGVTKMGKPMLSVFGAQGPLLSMMMVLAFFVASIVAYSAVLPEYIDRESGLSVDFDAADAASQRRWSVIDALYFAVTTITTVGYGDLHPRSPSGVRFTCFFVFVAVFGVGLALGTVAQFFYERAEQKREAAVADFVRSTKPAGRDANGRQVLVRVRDAATRRNIRASRRATARVARATRCLRTIFGLRKSQVLMYWSLCKALLPLVLAALLGLVLAPIEGWSLGLSLYVSSITLTSVGFGDFSPTTQAGRLYSVFYIPLGITIVFGVMGKLVEIYTLAHTPNFGIREILKMDRDGDGEVNLVEYQLFMLKNMGKIGNSDLALLKHQFSILDKSGDGTLSAADIDDETEQAAMACNSRKIRV